MKFKFDDKAHVYTLDGKRLYGVTSVLGVINKPALVQWSASEAVKYVDANLIWNADENEFLDKKLSVLKEAKVAHRKKKDGAADIGTSIHSMAEELIKGAMDEEGGYFLSGDEGHALTEKSTDIERKAITQFVDWAVKNNAKFLASEKKMYSEKMWVAGTADFICEIDGKKYLGDIKTTSGIYDKTPFLQCAAYRLMCEEMGEKGFNGSIIIRLGKDGSFEEKYSYDFEGDSKGFLAALELFKSLEAYKVK